METASAAGQPDPENYCIQLLMVPQEQQATDIGDDPTDDSFLLPGPNDGMNSPMDNGMDGMDDNMEDMEDDEDMMPGNMAEGDSFAGYTSVLDVPVSVNVSQKARYESNEFRDRFVQSRYAKHPLRLAIQEIKSGEIAVFEGYSGTVLNIAHNWSNGHYRVLKAAFDEGKTLDIGKLSQYSGYFGEGDYIGGMMGGAMNKMRGMAQGAKNMMGGGNQQPSSHTGQAVKTAQEALMVLQRMGINARDRVQVVIKAAGQNRVLKGIATEVAMQIQQQATAAVVGVVIVQATRMAMASGNQNQQQMNNNQEDYSEMVTKEDLEKAEQKIKDLENRLAQSEYEEKVRSLTLVPGTPEELAKQLVVLQSNVGETAVTEQLRSWNAEQYNAESSQFGESLLEAVGGVQASSFEEYVNTYMEAHPNASRIDAFKSVGKAHPELRESEV